MLWAKNTELVIFLASLVPLPGWERLVSPAMIKFNRALSSIVQQCHRSDRPVEELKSFQVFAEEKVILDEHTGWFADSYVMEPGMDRYFNKGRLNVAGWFKLRNYWFKEIGKAMSKWCIKISQARDLNLPCNMWRSPSPVIELDVSMERI